MVLILLSCLLLDNGLLGNSGSGSPRPPTMPELRTDLLKREQQDQRARKAMLKYLQDANPRVAPDPSQLTPEQQKQWGKLAKSVAEIDARNTKWLDGVVSKSGWPTKEMVGADGVHAAWLIVQHADAAPKFQRRCLDLMRKLSKSDVSPIDLAYLTDRVLLAEGKKQRYGTQFSTVDGELRPRPLENPKRVDERRRSVGLPPMKDYIELLKRQYGPKVDS